MPDPGQSPTTAADTQIATGELLLDYGKARGQVLQTPLLLPPLGLRGVAANPAAPAVSRNLQTLADPANARTQTPGLGRQIAHGKLPGILAGPGDRPGPARRTGRRHRLFARATGLGFAIGVEAAFPAPLR